MFLLFIVTAVTFTLEIALPLLLPSSSTSLLSLFVSLFFPATTVPLFPLLGRLFRPFGSVGAFPSGVTFCVYFFLVDVAPAVTVFSVAVTITTVIFPVISKL